MLFRTASSLLLLSALTVAAARQRRLSGKKEGSGEKGMEVSGSVEVDALVTSITVQPEEVGGRCKLIVPVEVSFIGDIEFDFEGDSTFFYDGPCALVLAGEPVDYAVFASEQFTLG